MRLGVRVGLSVVMCFLKVGLLIFGFRYLLLWMLFMIVLLLSRLVSM